MDPAETDPHPVSAGSGSGKTGYRSGSGRVEMWRNRIHIWIFQGGDPAKPDPDKYVAGSGCFLTFKIVLRQFGTFGNFLGCL